MTDAAQGSPAQGSPTQGSRTQGSPTQGSPTLGSPALDPTVPNVARMYDFMLGGKDNYASDREAVARLIEISPEVHLAARWNRQFLGRAVRFVAGQGVTQFLDVGAGLPTQHNVHEVAQEVTADASTVYVDNDPVVLAHANALLAGDARTAVVAGDVRDPAGILRDAEATGLLDLARPACLLLVAILHFVPDADDPAKLVAAFRDALAPGSYLILSHATMDGYPVQAATASADRAGRVYDRASSQLTMRDRAEVDALLAGFDLVEPGLVHVTDWRPAEPPRLTFDAFLGAVGVRS
jgi:SAM-dependent methyltransferase